MREETLYERLELSITASTDEIKQSFRRLAKEYHPDTNPSDVNFSQKFHSIRAAYEILIDPELRKNYNKSLRETLAKYKKEKIQEKLFTIDIATKLEIILAWSTTRPTFRTSFTSSCLNRMAEGRDLSPKQIECIDNIMVSFEIDIDQWLDDDLRRNAIDEFLKKESFSMFNPDQDHSDYMTKQQE